MYIFLKLYVYWKYFSSKVIHHFFTLSVGNCELLVKEKVRTGQYPIALDKLTSDEHTGKKNMFLGLKNICGIQ